MTLLTLTLALAVLQAGMQLFDLYSTSEIIKRKLGYESNPRMVQITQDYWSFAAFKVMLAATAFVYPMVAYLYPSTDKAMVVLVAALSAYYFPIMQTNWRILRG